MRDDETQAVSDGIAALAARVKAPGRNVTLKLLTGTHAGRLHVIRGEVTVVGRASVCDVQIDEGSLSRKHCRIVRTVGGYVIEDLDSRNGTQVDGKKVKTARLNDGALIELAAGTTIKFAVMDD